LKARAANKGSGHIYFSEGTSYFSCVKETVGSTTVNLFPVSACAPFIVVDKNGNVFFVEGGACN